MIGKTGTVINHPCRLPGEPGRHLQLALPICSSAISVICGSPERLTSMGDRQLVKKKNPKLTFSLPFFLVLFMGKNKPIHICYLCIRNVPNYKLITLFIPYCVKKRNETKKCQNCCFFFCSSASQKWSRK